MTTPWLEQLEERVREASSRLRDLRQENAELRARVGELESALAAAGEGDGEAAAWAAERETIRERVEGLVQHLEQLLDD